ncbi:carbohydrate-binding family 9-like protein [Mediterraneibacter agrestimuris]|uniref:carbohydrate-binding family 9-like protein n=1 Tax=Mediterraneibacter agrestimuris TaxID=2941333 RepID=UPI00203C734A|nr:carbohydrate-binding family 9-like protein [Mediterraneibacter agrestimuris]
MKLDVGMIERKEELTKLPPFHVENALWGTESFPKMYGYLGFVPEDAFYLKMICEEVNPLRRYKRANEPVYQDSAMEAFLMFEPVRSRLAKELYLNLEVNANGALLAGYGTKRTYRAYFTGAEHARFECHAEIHEKDWSAELRIPIILLERIYGSLKLGEGSYFTCNFYKISETKEFEHYASYAPIHSSVPSFHVPEFFADAEIVKL